MRDRFFGIEDDVNYWAEQEKFRRQVTTRAAGIDPLTAQQLGQAYASNPNVNPQILASVVLGGGNQEVLSQISEIAARQQMRDNYGQPSDLGRRYTLPNGPTGTSLTSAIELLRENNVARLGATVDEQGEEGGDDGIFGWLHKGLKGTVRGAMAISESGWQATEAFIRGVTDFDGETDLELADVVRNTSLYEIFRQATQEGGVDLGSGYFTGGTVQENQAARQKELLGSITLPGGEEKTWNAGLGFARALSQSNVIPYNDIAWNIASGFYSAVGAITFDPLNALGIGIAQRGATSVDNLARLGSRTGRKVNNAIEGARTAEESGDFVTALKYNQEALDLLGDTGYVRGNYNAMKERLTGLGDSRIAVESFLRDEAGFVSAGGQRTLLIPEFVRYMTKDESLRALDYMVNEKDTAKIWRLHKGKIGASIIEEIAAADNIEDVIRTYAYALGNPGESMRMMIGYLPEMGMLNLPEKGLVVRNIIAPYTRWFNYLPDGSILDPRDGNAYISRADSLYATMPTAATFKTTARGRVKVAVSEDKTRRLQRYDVERRDEMVRRSIKAFATGDSTAIKNLNSEMAEDFRRMFVKMGWSDEEASALTRWAMERDRLSQYSLMDIQNPVDPSESPIMTSQLLQSGATIIDPNKLQEVLRGSGRVRQMRRLNTQYHRLSDQNVDLVTRIQEAEGGLLLETATSEQKARWAEELNELNKKQRAVKRQVDELAASGDITQRSFVQGAIMRGDYFMSQWWKPLTLVRAAYILRIVPEEIARVTVGGVFGLGQGAFMDYILASLGDINKFGDKGRYQLDALGNRFARQATKSAELSFRQQDLLDELKVARTINDETAVQRLTAELSTLQDEIDVIDNAAVEAFEEAMISRRRGQSLATVTREGRGATIGDRRLLANMSGGKALATRSIGAQRDNWVDGLTDYYFQAANDNHVNKIARVAAGQGLPKSDRFSVGGVVGNWDQHVGAGRIRDAREGLVYWMQSGGGRADLDELIKSYAANGRILDPEDFGDVAYVVDKQVEHLATMVGGKPANAAFSPSSLGEPQRGLEYVYTPRSAQDDVPELFHGTSKAFAEGRLVDQSMYSRGVETNLIGPGFYTTDAPNLAKDYTKKGRGKDPAVYSVNWVGENPPRVVDLNRPLSENPDLQNVFRRMATPLGEATYLEIGVDDFDRLLEVIEQGTGYEAYRELYKTLDGNPSSAVNDIVADLQDTLRDFGDVLLHEGGVQGGAKHNVYVWINEGDVQVTKAADQLFEAAPKVEAQRKLYNVVEGGEQDLLEAIATKRFGGTNLKVISKTSRDLEINSAFRDRLRNFADNPNAPERVLYNNNKHNGEERFSFLRDRIVEPFFTRFYGIPSDKLSRSPAFRRFYWLQMEELVRSANDQAAAQLVRNAEAAGLPKNLLDRIQGAAKGRVTVPGGGADLATLDDVAKGAALARVKELLYDASRRGAAMDQLRLVTPFGDAWKEVWQMWGQEMVRQRGLPVKRLAKGVQGLRDANVMEQDPITNEWHVSVPYSDKLSKLALNRLGDSSLKDFPTAPFTMPAQSLNVLGTFSPGVGPVLNVAINSLVPDDPQWDAVRDWLFPVAEPALPDTEAAKNNLWQQLVFPSPWIRRGAAALPGSGPLGVLRNFVNDIESDPSYQATRNHVVQSLASARPVSETRGAENQKKLFDDADAIARRMFFMRGVFSFIGPGAPMPRYIAETGQGNMPAALLTDEIRKLEQELLAAGEPPGLAMQMAIDVYGPEIWMYTASNSNSTIKGAQSSDSWWDWYRSGGDQLVDKFPTIGSYFGETGDFSIDAYGSLFARGIYERKTGDALYEEAATDIAFLAYNRLREQFPAESQRTLEQRRLLASAREAIQQYWGISLSGSTRIEERDVQIRELQRMIAAAEDGDKLARQTLSTETGERVMEYMAMRAMFSEQAITMLGAQTPTSFRQMRSAAPFRDALREMGTRLSQEDPTFGRIYQFVLEGELFDDEDQSDMQGLPARTQSAPSVAPGRPGRSSIIPRVRAQAGV